MSDQTETQRSDAGRYTARSAVLLLALAAAASGADFAALAREGHVSDFGRVVDPASRLAIEEYSKRLQAATGAELAIVTLPSLAGEPIEGVAGSIFRRWEIGRKGAGGGTPRRNLGVLLLLSVGERRSRTEVGDGLAAILPEGAESLILGAMRPDLRHGDYGAALLAGAQAVGSRIATARGIRVADPVRPAGRVRRSEPFPWLVAAGGLSVAACLALFAMRRGRRHHGGYAAPLLAGHVIGRTEGGGRGGGGFGGFDSSDSFGGFGGGDSGGGVSNW